MENTKNIQQHAPSFSCCPLIIRHLCILFKKKHYNNKNYHVTMQPICTSWQESYWRLQFLQPLQFQHETGIKQLKIF